MTKRGMTRRDCLRLSVIAGGAALGGSALLQACSKDEGGQGQTDCTDTSGLSEQEMMTRKSVKYVAESPEPEKKCSNCKLYTAPKSGSCGSCEVVKGPIAPEGYCTAWVEKA